MSSPTLTCTEYETVYEDRPRTTYKPVWETQTRELRYRVGKPVAETSEREEVYTVQRPVWETHYRDASYTRVRYVQETAEREVRQIVNRELRADNPPASSPRPPVRGRARA